MRSHRRIRRGIVLVPEGRHLFADLSVEDNLAARRAALAPPGEARRNRGRSRAMLCLVSGPAAPRLPARRHPVRRTTADGCRWTRVDESAQLPVARRTIAWSRSPCHSADLPGPDGLARQAQPVDRSCGAGCASGPRHRRPRIRHAASPHRAQRERCRTARQSTDPGNLFRRRQELSGNPELNRNSARPLPSEISSEISNRTFDASRRAKASPKEKCMGSFLKRDLVGDGDIDATSRNRLPVVWKVKVDR